MQMIKEEAIKLVNKIYPGKPFRASNGWFSRFIKRNRLSRRAATHSIQKITGETESQILEFWSNIKKSAIIKLLQNEK